MEKPNIKEVTINVNYYEDLWQLIKDCALFTIHKKKGKYPNSDWKRKILRAEHSPIRAGYLVIDINRSPQFVHGHLVRHHVGVEKFIESLRYDRATYEDTPDRNTLQDGRYIINFASFINISRKRCCNCASYETRYIWNLILKEIEKYEPELYKLCVRECVYRNGLCPEMKSCCFNKTKEFIEELKEYQKQFDDQIADIVKL